MAKPVLRHRIFTNFNADAEGVDTDQIIERLLSSVREPAYGEKGSPPALLVVTEVPGGSSMNPAQEAQPPVAPNVSP